MQGDLFRDTSGMGLRERERIALLKFEYHQWRRAFVGPKLPCNPHKKKVKAVPRIMPTKEYRPLPPVVETVAVSVAKKPPRHINAEIVQQRMDAAGNGLRVSGPVVNTKTKVRFTCSKKHIWVTLLNSAAKVKECPECRKEKITCGK